MKFFHLSDLHLGKRLKEFSLLEDQKYILEQILSLTEEHRPDAVVIAGDVYDKSVPSAEAVELFDDFLTRMAKLQTPVLIISGNHDSPERIAFGADLMTGSGIYMSPVYDGTVRKVTLKDELGPVDFYLLPFIKPVHVRKALGVDETATENEAAADAGADSKFPEIKTYTQAMEAAIQQMQVDTTGRNVLITHQFVTNAIRSESEEISVGGSDNVDASVFAPFDYVALGHLHGPQWVDRETVRYCGSPLKYSFSEVDQEKSVTVVEMKGKGCVNIGTLPLKPLREMRKLKGAYNDLMDRKS